MMDGSALDLAAVLGEMNRNDRSDSFGSMGGIWILILLFFIFAIGGNFGGNRSNGGGGGFSPAMNELSNEFLFTNLNNTLNQGFTQVANQSFGIQNSLCEGFGGVQMSLAQNQYAADKCCCETNRNIDSVRYENAKNTCDIITASNANTQRILDKMCESEVNQLRTDLQSAQLQLSNNAQTQTLINSLRPVPIPAYPSFSPYQTLFYNGLNGCGCNYNI